MTVKNYFINSEIIFYPLLNRFSTCKIKGSIQHESITMSNTTKLADFLRAATPEEREQCATKAGTSVQYLYQLAGLHRTNPGVQIAVGIERATTEMSRESDGRLPVVTALDLAEMARMADFDDVGCGDEASGD